MSRLFFIFGIVILLLTLTNCTNVTFVPTVTLPAQEISLIKSWGVVTATCAKISYDVDVSVTPVYTGGGLLGAIAAGIDAGLEASAIESGIEKGGTTGLAYFLDDWNFGNIFQQTFYEEFKRCQPNDSVRLFKNILYKDLNKDVLPQFVQGCDAILNINITHYGLESKSTKGFSIFVNAIIEVIRVKDKKIIASHTIRFDKDYIEIMKRQMYDLYVKQQANLQQEKLPKGERLNYVEFKKTVPPPSSIFSIPFSVLYIEDYVQNDASLLKKQLKLAAIEVCRAFIQFLQLEGFIGLQSTVAEYLSRPSIQ